jgi:quercetin dioxygenase-like cupin family protein
MTAVIRETLGATESKRASALDLLRQYAADPTLIDRLDPSHTDPATTERQWVNLRPDGNADLWLISWPADSRTGWHDHGTASGAFLVLEGTLTECSWDGAVHARTLRKGQGRSFGAGHIHDVVNTSGVPALSMHAYTPRLTTMTRYRLERGHLGVVSVERAGDW